MWMVAIKEHGYAGRRIPVGKTFQVNSPSDAAILRVAGLARNARPSEIESPKIKPPEIKSPVVKEDDVIVYEESHRKAVVETREEEPGEVDDDAEVDGQTKSRKRRRQYRRNDMVPE